MPLHFVQCECGCRHSVRTSMAGELLECRHCGDSMTIPALSQLSTLPVDTENADVRWFDIPQKPWKSFSIRQLLVLTGVVAASLAAGLYLFGPMGPMGPRRDPIFDARSDRSTQTSDNLDRDKLIMWNTVPNRKGIFNVVPVSSINASRRVFESLKTKLIGKNLDEVRELIGYRNRPHYGYHDAFFGVARHAFVYRFDCGTFGCQYNLYLDDERIVTDVEYLWIE